MELLTHIHINSFDFGEMPFGRLISANTVYAIYKIYDITELSTPPPPRLVVKFVPTEIFWPLVRFCFCSFQILAFRSFTFYGLHCIGHRYVKVMDNHKRLEVF